MKFQCLKCGKVLHKTNDKLKCRRCNSSWNVENGIPQFSENAIYWGEIAKKDMIYVNRQLQKNKYWKSALKGIAKNYRDQYPEPYSFVTNLSRANWHFLLDKKRKALDIGSGMGTISEALSYYYKEVVSVEPVKERLYFCKKRFEQEGINNINLVNANALELPFAKNSFDLIVMNGVLEWVALYGKGDPKNVQKQVLKNVFKLLKPGGYVYIGIENRFCFKHFIGCYDPHVNLRFVTLLPRKIANLYSKIFLGKEYRTYIYSGEGYKNLLKEAGFISIEVYNSLPDYNVPTYIIPVTNGRIYGYLTDQLMISSGFMQKISAVLIKMLSWMGLIKYILPAYIILGKR